MCDAIADLTVYDMLHGITAPQARDSSVLRQRIRELAMMRPRFGYQRIRILLIREGWQVGGKRVYRLYKLEGLQVRMRVRRRKRISLHRGPVPTATRSSQYRAMDFMHDQLLNGRTLRVLTVTNKWHRQCVALQADFALTGQSVVDAPTKIARERSLPVAITVDHDTEFTSNVLDECLNVTESISIDHARMVLNTWLEDYNHHRPRSSLGHLTPSEFANKGQKTDSAALKSWFCLILKAVQPPSYLPSTSTWY